jgi:GH35 family endo-1,4-beta-xylanase
LRGRITDPATPDNLRYRAEVERLFNTIVFENDLKWDNKNPRKTEQALEALKWLQARNIAVRGHTLVWGARKWLPAEAVAAWDDTEKLREMVRNRVREQATTFKGQLYVWDVVNEAATNTELWEKLGWDEFANIFKIARQVDPTVKLAYNDYNISNESQDLPRMQKHRQRVAEIIRMLKEKGAPVDIYGDQAHFGLPLTPPARMVEIWNEVAKLGLPIELTELDAGIPEDKLHGEYIRDVLIAAFSVPQVEGVIMWGFWEGAHWRAGEGGAMFRKDWSKRPAQEAYEDLVLKQWRTKTAGTTNARGEYSTRGFLGDYNVMVSVKGKTHTMRTSLPRHGRNLIIKIM